MEIAAQSAEEPGSSVAMMSSFVHKIYSGVLGLLADPSGGVRSKVYEFFQVSKDTCVVLH